MWEGGNDFRGGGAGNDYGSDPRAEYFQAEITGVTQVAGIWVYSWERVIPDAVTGEYSDDLGDLKEGGDSTRSPLYEVNNASVPTGSVVFARLRGYDARSQGPAYEFQAPAGRTSRLWAYVTGRRSTDRSGAGSGDGSGSGSCDECPIEWDWQRVIRTGCSWTILDDDLTFYPVVEINNRPLIKNTVYSADLADDGCSVLVDYCCGARHVSNVCGTGITVEYTQVDPETGNLERECVSDPEGCCDSGSGDSGGGIGVDGCDLLCSSLPEVWQVTFSGDDITCTGWQNYPTLPQEWGSYEGSQCLQFLINSSNIYVLWQSRLESCAGACCPEYWDLYYYCGTGQMKLRLYNDTDYWAVYDTAGPVENCYGPVTLYLSSSSSEFRYFSGPTWPDSVTATSDGCTTTPPPPTPPVPPSPPSVPPCGDCSGDTPTSLSVNFHPAYAFVCPESTGTGPWTASQQSDCAWLASLSANMRIVVLQSGGGFRAYVEWYDGAEWQTQLLYTLESAADCCGSNRLTFDFATGNPCGVTVPAFLDIDGGGCTSPPSPPP